MNGHQLQMLAALLLATVATGCSSPRRPEVVDTLTSSKPPVAGINADLGITPDSPATPVIPSDTLVAPQVEAPPTFGDSALASESLMLMIPVEGVKASDLRDTYGDPRTGHAHEAIDIIAPRGTPVLSASDGRLTKLFVSKPGGIMVYAADPSDGFILMYGHLDRYTDGLVEGMPLVRGQLIGYVGSTGNVAEGNPHLHFAIARGKPSVAWWKGDPVNPYPLLSRGDSRVLGSSRGGLGINSSMRVEGRTR